ncbi:hypothetical protein AGR3A_Cc190075 [Agrobacterium tomkonis CFBP 6623]|uniref:Uncharacterized protein n=2 Tax=Agrobacterium tumefaciens complex TaxID=1183400 RepID=A0A1S7P115_9HYPH|nr:hypothetical protein AGR3A_Cc190075 [Agrobacterium tomkonis CFBP 6623]CUX20915.1 hypothetical protein AGR13a_Cc210131 [Agrobacterium genomosp. 13 str. CFBP 6927]
MNGQKDTAIGEQDLSGSVLADIQETELL